MDGAVFTNMKLDPRLLRLVREYQAVFLVTILLGIAGGVLVVWQARLLSQVVDGVFMAGWNLSDVAGIMLGLLVVIGLRSLSVYGMEYSAGALAARIKRDLRQRLFVHISALGPSFTWSERTGDLTSVVLNGARELDAYFSQYLPQVILAVAIPIITLLFILPLDVLSAVVLLLTAPLIPIFMVLIGGFSQSVTRQQWQTLRRMSAYFLDVLQGLTTLKIMGRSLAQIKVIAQISERYRQTTMGVLRVTFLSALVLEMVATISTAVVAVEIGLRLLYGRLSFPEALFVLLLAPEFYLPLRNLGARFHAGMAGVAAAESIFAILETPLPDSGAGSGREAVPKLDSGQVIRFEHLQYAYPDGNQALRDVHFELESGNTLALVGPSGAGKSTLANLLLGFILPVQGVIRIAGTDLRHIPLPVWLSQVAWVPQKPYLFNDTVEANIRLAQPEASLEAIRKAAYLANAEEFIQRLPYKYQTVIGERGSHLSAGQAQRIALARAFLKNAPLVVMDEPSANLDPENEALIREATGRLLEGRTAIIIAHRLNTVYQADKIVVLRDGRLLESGSHSELLQDGDFYPKLVQAYAGATGAESKFQPHVTSPDATEASSPAQVMAGTPLPYTPPEPGQRSALTRLLKLISPYKARIALSVFLGFATVMSGIGLMTTSAYIISVAALQPSIAVLQVPIVGVRFFGISRGLFRYLERLVTHDVAFRILANLRVWFYRRVEPLAPARLSRYRSGDLLARVIQDIGQLENFYVRALAPPLVAICVTVVVTTFLYGFKPSLAMNALLFLCLAGLGVPRLTRWLGRQPGRQLLGNQARLSSELVDGIQGMADLWAFGRIGDYQQRLATTSTLLAANQTRFAFVNGLQSALVALFTGLAAWGALYLAIPLVSSAQIEGIYLAGIVLATLTSFEAATPLPLAAQYMEANLSAARRLFEIADAPPAVRDVAEPLPLPAFSQLELKDIEFHYPVHDVKGQAGFSPVESTPVLDAIGFDLVTGKRIAIVGASGAGKSTLVNLLQRFWEYQAGEIMLDGKDYRQYGQVDIRAMLAVIEQNAHMFDATIRENILIARPEASEDDLQRVIKVAQLDNFIQALPEGLNSRVGEAGAKLSAGECQRIAVARALLREKPILIMDEPTAHLDALTERRLLEGIFDLGKPSAMLLISHRLIGMERMDRILVIKNGRIIEHGRHKELVTKQGYYSRMWALQNELLGASLAGNS